MTCRKYRLVTSKPGAHLSPGMSLAGTCLLARRCPACRWREFGSGVRAELGNLSFRNRGRVRAKMPWSREGDPQATVIARGRVPVAEHRGGPVRSSDEGPVMGLERRSRATRWCLVANRLHGRSHRDATRPSGVGRWLSGTSRMSREAHVRICGSRGVRFPPATRRGAGCR
jgi:hypothetical protein